ncbi:lysophospholipid acyltransferase family protein [soil metagenome]
MVKKKPYVRPTDFSDVSKGTARRHARTITRYLLYPLMRLAFGFRIKGTEHLPKTGPYILIANHLHNIDPLLLQIAVPRNIHFFTKREAFEYPGIREVALWSGAFPVDRGTADRWAIRRAEAALAQGIPVGIYPEGTRSTTLGLQKGFSGAGLIALRSGVPVVPSIITGSERMPFNGKKGQLNAGATMPDPGHKGVLIQFGAPFVIPREIDGKRVSSEQATDMMMIALAKMLPPDYRGIYAGLAGEPATL